MMRHGSRPFVVEVKRGQKRTSVIHAVETPDPPQPTIAESSLDEIFRRAEAALFERAADKPVTSTPAVDAPAAPERRILENLTQVDPLTALLAERGEASRRGRKPGSKNKPKDVTAQDPDKPVGATTNGSVELTAERINEALKAMERATGVHSQRRSGPPPVKPARARIPVPVGLVEPAAAAEAAMVAERAPVAEPATARPLEAGVAAPDAKARERGSIRKRYVTGTEPRPGERWKRRLRGIQ